jgi:hypothetical protein
MWRQGKGLGKCARRLLAAAATIKIVDGVLPQRREERSAGLRLRVVATPEPPVAKLLAHLGLVCPLARESSKM